MFEGFPEETVRFFLDLKFHNEMTWFHAHRDEYEQYVRKPFYGFIEAMTPSVLSIAEDMETRPHKCLARINRDIRYTRDKSPYRDHLWLLFRRANEERDKSVHYWFELSPRSMEWGLGYWGQNREAMDQFRKLILEKPDAVRKAFRCLKGTQLCICGERYKKMKLPDGLAPDLEPLYTLKEIYIQRMGTSLADAYSPEIIQQVSQDYLTLKPIYQLLRLAADRAIARPVES